MFRPPQSAAGARGSRRARFVPSRGTIRGPRQCLDAMRTRRDLATSVTASNVALRGTGRGYGPCRDRFGRAALENVPPGGTGTGRRPTQAWTRIPYTYGISTKAATPRVGTD